MAVDLSLEYNIDPTKEIEGVWEDIGGDARLRVARSGNDNFQEAYSAIPKAIRNKIEKSTLPKARVNEIISGIMAKTILLDFEGLEDEGKPLEYSVKSAEHMLNKYAEFRDFVFQLSNDASRFAVDSEEEDTSTAFFKSVKKKPTKDAEGSEESDTA